MTKHNSYLPTQLDWPGVLHANQTKTWITYGYVTVQL